MKIATRFAIIGASAFLCAGGIVIVHSVPDASPNNGKGSGSIDVNASGDGYEFAASSARPKLTFQQLETIIRRDPTAKLQRGRIDRLRAGTTVRNFFPR